MNWLFDIAWWIPVAVVLGGAVAFVMGNSRRQLAVRNAGLAAVGLGIALALVSYFVDTPVEKAEKASRRFVQAFVEQDWETFSGLLDRKVSLSAQGVPLAFYSNRDELIQAARDAQAQYGFTSIRVTSANGKWIDGLIPVYLTLFSEQQATLGRPFPSTWEFDWQDYGDGYKITRITAILIANESPDRLKGQFPRK